jgi:hypothetical protein
MEEVFYSTVVDDFKLVRFMDLLGAVKSDAVPPLHSTLPVLEVMGLLLH